MWHLRAYIESTEILYCLRFISSEQQIFCFKYCKQSYLQSDSKYNKFLGFFHQAVYLMNFADFPILFYQYFDSKSLINTV